MYIYIYICICMRTPPPPLSPAPSPSALLPIPPLSSQRSASLPLFPLPRHSSQTRPADHSTLHLQTVRSQTRPPVPKMSLSQSNGYAQGMRRGYAPHTSGKPVFGPPGAAKGEEPGAAERAEGCIFDKHGYAPGVCAVYIYTKNS